MPDAEADGLDDGDDDGLLFDGDGVDEDPPPDPPPPEGDEVGDEDGAVVGDEVGADVGDDVGEGEGELVVCTGGATAGGVALPLPCFHAQPTEPPAGTVREPELYDE